MKHVLINEMETVEIMKQRVGLDYGRTVFNKVAECCISLRHSPMLLVPSCGIDLHGDIRYAGSQRDLLQIRDH